ncbi:hypothetical protein SORBI_3009G106300 [Sorghum bicolor]|uniref:Uncharacterized protein n=1 Tax=Sorghum bicolor TaxID=4558 RepID=A0A1B6P7R3_SORBI|nr:hypothetical protein SORBI_3009G106300 [Sorghum bicolor]
MGRHRHPCDALGREGDEERGRKRRGRPGQRRADTGVVLTGGKRAAAAAAPAMPSGERETRREGGREGKAGARTAEARQHGRALSLHTAIARARKWRGLATQGSALRHARSKNTTDRANLIGPHGGHGLRRSRRRWLLPALSSPHSLHAGMSTVVA